MTCYGRHVAVHPELFPQSRTRRGAGGKRDDLGGQYFRSAWEANWARYLNLLKKYGEVLAWDFESETFEFVGIKRGSRFYTPDFRVVRKNGGTEYHEVKGWMDPRSATKLKRMAKYYPEVRIILIDKDVYSATAHSVSGLIPEWETVRGRAAR